MHIAITGSSGLVGRELMSRLAARGDQITKLVRRTPGEGEVQWDPQASSFDASGLDDVDAIVHLAGENIAAARWNARVKEKIRSSRVEGTRVLCEGLAAMRHGPSTFVSASAIGIYGDRGDEILTEDSEPGEGFLAEVVRDWEAAAQPARDAGIRVANLRFGVILNRQEGALSKMLLPFRLGGGGIVGSGRQYWSWVTAEDAAGAILHTLDHEELSGVVNAVSPNPATNWEFTKALGSVLRRPTFMPMPAFAARLALGEMVNELLLPSARVMPTRLEQTGYAFQHPELRPALQELLA